MLFLKRGGERRRCEEIKPAVFGNIFISMNVCYLGLAFFPQNMKEPKYCCEVAFICTAANSSSLFQLEMLNLSSASPPPFLSSCWGSGFGPSGLWVQQTHHSPLSWVPAFNNPSAEKLNGDHLGYFLCC